MPRFSDDAPSIVSLMLASLPHAGPAASGDLAWGYPLRPHRATIALLTVLLVGTLGFDVHELEGCAGAIGLDAYGVLFVFRAGFQRDFVGFWFFVIAG